MSTGFSALTSGFHLVFRIWQSLRIRLLIDSSMMEPAKCVGGGGKHDLEPMACDQKPCQGVALGRSLPCPPDRAGDHPIVMALEDQLDWIISWWAVGHSDDHYSGPFLLTPGSSQQLCSA